MNVVCVYRSESALGQEYVTKMATAAKMHGPSGTVFYCITDDGTFPSSGNDVDHFLTPFCPEWSPVWSKIEAFRIPGPTLYLDLDTVIMGDLTEALGAISASEVVLLGDPAKGARSGRFLSSIFGWAGDHQGILSMLIAGTREWRPETMGRIFGVSPRLSAGDGSDVNRPEDWIRRFLYWGQTQGVVGRNSEVTLPVRLQTAMSTVAFFARDMIGMGTHAHPPEGTTLVSFAGADPPGEISNVENWYTQNWQNL